MISLVRVRLSFFFPHDKVDTKMLQSSVIIVLKENKLVKVLGITEPVNHRELENSLMLIQNTDDFMEVKLKFYLKKKTRIFHA